MAFKWITPENKSRVDTTEELPTIDTEDQEIVLGRLKHNNEIVGCCGQVRKDTIYPIGLAPDREIFIKEAIEIVDTYELDKDTYSIEQFYGKPGQNFREDGESIFLLEYKDGLWHFYSKGKFIFTCSNQKELEDLWQT